MYFSFEHCLMSFTIDHHQALLFYHVMKTSDFCDHSFLVSFPGISSFWVLAFNGVLSYVLISSYFVHFPKAVLSTCIVQAHISAELHVHKTSCLLYIILQAKHSMTQNKLIFSPEFALPPGIFNTNLWHCQLLSIPSQKLGNYANMFYKTQYKFPRLMTKIATRLVALLSSG